MVAVVVAEFSDLLNFTHKKKVLDGKTKNCGWKLLWATISSKTLRKQISHKNKQASEVPLSLKKDEIAE